MVFLTPWNLLPSLVLSFRKTHFKWTYDTFDAQMIENRQTSYSRLFFGGVCIWVSFSVCLPSNQNLLLMTAWTSLFHFLGKIAFFLGLRELELDWPKLIQVALCVNGTRTHCFLLTLSYQIRLALQSCRIVLLIG